MNFKQGDLVSIKRDIYRVASKTRRHQELYVQEGDTGEIQEIFRGKTPAGLPGYIWYAKVKMNTGIDVDRIKTLRLTSLCLISLIK